MYAINILAQDRCGDNLPAQKERSFCKREIEQVIFLIKQLLQGIHQSHRADGKET